MGKLRMEPRHKDALTKAEFDHYLSILRNASRMATDHQVYWDLEKNEKAVDVKKAFIHVAEKSGIEATIRRVRGQNSLSISFGKKGKSPSGRPTRMSAEATRKLILDCLDKADGPVKKTYVIKETGVSPSTWNIRIKALLDEGAVIREGVRRETTYRLA